VEQKQHLLPGILMISFSQVVELDLEIDQILGIETSVIATEII
jgi:hypothetical protein